MVCSKENSIAIFKFIKNLKDEKEYNKFLNEIFTSSEIEALYKRWRILEMLNDGLTQREIAKKLNVSLCKVTRGAKIIKDKNSIVYKFLKEKINENL